MAEETSDRRAVKARELINQLAEEIRDPHGGQRGQGSQSQSEGVGTIEESWAIVDAAVEALFDDASVLPTGATQIRLTRHAERALARRRWSLPALLEQARVAGGSSRQEIAQQLALPEEQVRDLELGLTHLSKTGPDPIPTILRWIEYLNVAWSDAWRATQMTMRAVNAPTFAGNDVDSEGREFLSRLLEAIHRKQVDG